MSDKTTKLSIIIATVDKATAKIKAINDRLDAVTKPIRDFKKQLGDLREKSGLDDVIGGFKGVGSAIEGILSKVAIIGGVIGAATAGLFHLVDGFDDLGDKAERIGVSVDFLAQMRYAAERSGASVDELDSGLQNFSKSLGQARAGTGRFASFLGHASKPLLAQLKATKSNEEALDLYAAAMAKVVDPAERAALAQAAFGNAGLAPLFAKGQKGVKALRDEHFKAAGSMEAAAKAAGETDDALKNLKASTDGVKAALVSGLAPALTIIVKQLQEWFTAHREDIKEWAASIGERLPAAFNALVGAVSSVIDFIRPFVDSTTKLKIIALALAGIIVGPLVASIYTLGVALLTTPVGWIIGGIAAIAAGAYLLIDNWDAVSTFFSELWDTVTGKFSWAKSLIKLALAPFIGVPVAIVAAWGNIKDFFSSLWGGITSVFSKAYDFIKDIVDKIVAAVDFVANKVKEFVNGTEGGRAELLNRMGGGVGLTPEQRDNFIKGRDIGANANSSATVKVDFANAPPGTRVRTDPKSTADVDFSVGYQMMGWGT